MDGTLAPKDDPAAICILRECRLKQSTGQIPARFSHLETKIHTKNGSGVQEEQECARMESVVTMMASATYVSFCQ